MLNCSVCGSKLNVSVVEGRKYIGLCQVCGVEHVLYKKERFRVGDKVCKIEECDKENKKIGVIEEACFPEFLWGTTWFPTSYKVWFDPGAYGKNSLAPKGVYELDLMRVEQEQEHKQERDPDHFNKIDFTLHGSLPLGPRCHRDQEIMVGSNGCAECCRFSKGIHWRDAEENRTYVRCTWNSTEKE